jgi:hypothetical protein
MDFLEIPGKDNLRTLLWWYVVIAVLLIWSQWRAKRSVGLPLVYFFALSQLHVIAACAHAFDYYVPRSAYLVQGDVTMATTYIGFRATLWGMLAFLIGCYTAPAVFSKEPPILLHRAYPQVTSKLPGTMLTLSLAVFFVLSPILRLVPSLGSMATAGTMCSILALFLLIYSAQRAGLTSKFYGWIASLAMFPLVTTLFLGFAGYGVGAASNVLVMVSRFFRPRWLFILLFACFVYGGMSFFVAYMKHRGEIRAQVWGGGGLSARMDSIFGLLTIFEWFDPYNQVHLELIDTRVNTNDSVGKAVKYIGSGNIDFAKGGTFYVAAVAWIPRILWPGKPATGGSGTVVSRYTGQKFADSTSVGAGNVFEFYINFGYPGVFWGFFLLGFLLRYFDLKAGFYLNQGDLWTFVRYALPPMGIINPGGISSEMVGTLASNTVFVILLHRTMFGQYYDDRLARPMARGSRFGTT